jgi:hypothetical protein
MPTLNWAQLIEDSKDGGGDYSPIPSGDYEFVVVEAPLKTTSTGKIMFSMKAQVTGGAHDKRLVWDNFVISPENNVALAIFFSQMAALGLKKEGFFDRGPSPEQISTAMAGRRFRGTVGTKVYQGKTSNEIKQYYTTQNTPAPVAGAAAPVAAPAPAPAPMAAPAPSGAPVAPVAAPAPVVAPVETPMAFEAPVQAYVEAPAVVPQGAPEPPF